MIFKPVSCCYNKLESKDLTIMSWSLTIRDFVRANKYKTEAEKFGWSFVFQDFVSVELKSKVTETIKVSIFLSLQYMKSFWPLNSA